MDYITEQQTLTGYEPFMKHRPSTVLHRAFTQRTNMKALTKIGDLIDRFEAFLERMADHVL